MSLNITSGTEGSSLNMGEPYSPAKFIPILSLFTEMNRDFSNSFEFVSLVLQKPLTMLEGSYTYSNSSNKIIQYLNTSAFLRRVETNGLVIHIGKGVIYDDNDNILLCFTVRRQFVLNSIDSVEGYYNNKLSEYNLAFVGYEPFIMFVSTEFANDKKYAVLYRRIKKIYLDSCFEKGIEMRLISSSKIKENTFANNLKIKFNSLTELNRHLTEDVKHLFSTPLENFKENGYPLLLDTPPVFSDKKDSPWPDLIPEMENRIKALNQSRDSMLEDSDLEEGAFEQPNIQIDLEALSPVDEIVLREQIRRQSMLSIEDNTNVLSTTTNNLIQNWLENNRQTVDLESDINNSDRIIADALALMAQQQDLSLTLAVAERYTPPVSVEDTSGLERTDLDEAFLAFQDSIEEEARQAEREYYEDYIEASGQDEGDPQL